jgi:Cu(I)/Ag(I) efflux system membrane fusion protein
MNTRQWLLLAAALMLIAGAGGYWLAQVQQQSATTAAHGAAGQERKVLYWYDPMVPNQHFDKPGKSPFMDMELVPKYADETAAAGVAIDPRTAQNLGVRLAAVERGAFSTAIDAVGTVAFNQREIAVVQARTSGFVERVYARAPGDVIAAGAALVDIRVPEWSSAQRELIALAHSGDRALLDAARERLRQLGMPSTLIAQVERSGAAQPVLTVAAPQAGVIQTLGVRAGMTVSAGMTLAEINGLRTVWLEAAVPEAQAQQIGVGNSIQVRFTATADQSVTGRVLAILPSANAVSRTLTVRAELPNADGQLRPGQFAQVRIEVPAATAQLWVPSEAVIRTGSRTVVIVAEDGRFRPVQVQIGADAGSRTAVLQGLSEGQQVVASAQFLIDSEANLSSALSRMENTAAETQP